MSFADYHVNKVAVSDLPDPWGPAPSRELVESVKMYGVIQPILVKMDDFPKIVDGNRRVMAAVLAKVQSVPVIHIYKSRGQSDADFSANVSEFVLAMNNLRSNNDLAEQQAYGHLSVMDRDVLTRTGLSRAALSKRERWELTHSVLVQGFYEGKIAPTVLDSASKLNAALQGELAVAYKATGKLTGAQVKALADQESVTAAPVELTPDQKYQIAEAIADEALQTLVAAAREVESSPIDMFVSIWQVRINQEFGSPPIKIVIHQNDDGPIGVIGSQGYDTQWSNGNPASNSSSVDWEDNPSSGAGTGLGRVNQNDHGVHVVKIVNRNWNDAIDNPNGDIDLSDVPF